MSVIDGPFSAERTAGRAPAATGRALPRLSNTALAIIAIIITAVAAAVPLVQSSAATTRGYQLHELERQRDDLRSRTHGFEVQVAELTSTVRLEQEARQRLGMVQPERTIVLWTNVGGPGQGYIPDHYRVDRGGNSIQRDSRAWWERMLQALLD